jgi:hypothetical protein
MSAQRLIDGLQGVQQVGPDRWRAICPAHASRNGTRSLSIRQLDDGTVLLNCFAGCEVSDVLDKAGVMVADLFPHRHRAPFPPRAAQRPNHWHAAREAVKTLEFEALVLALFAEDVGAGKPISAADARRCLDAAQRIRASLEAVK